MVHPPVDTDFFQPDVSDPAGPPSGVLVVSALVPYKRIELAIDACRAARLPLRIVGDGPERRALEARADGAVRFLGRLSDADVRREYRRCAVVLLPGEEDFGIVPLEAQACGRPVVALRRGGALETVIPGETGVLVDAPDASAFADAIAQAAEGRFDAGVIRKHAEQFSRSRFGDQMQALIEGAW